MEKDYISVISGAIMDLLKNQYPSVKNILIDLESKERIKVLASFTDLRDVFDHFYLALDCIRDPDFKADKEHFINQQITSANEHLRRAAIEPLETALEDIIAKIISKAKYNYYLSPLRLSKISNNEIRGKLKKATDTLSDVRKLKGQLNQLSVSLERMKKEYDDLSDFEKTLPSKRAAKLFLVNMVVAFLSIMIGIIIGFGLCRG